MTVKKCLVLQQGVGVINDIVNRPGLISQEELEKSTILVVDHGFFSMDYIAFKSGSRVSGSSGSSLKATSAIIESIVNRLNADNPEERIDDLPEIIEIALRNNEQSFFNGFRHISLRPLLEEAIPSIASDVVKELRKSTRVLGQSISLQLPVVGQGSTNRPYEKNSPSRDRIEPVACCQ